MDTVVKQVKTECLQILRGMDLPEIDVASVEEDSRPGLSAQIGDGTFNGVYRVRAVRGRGSAKNQIDNCCLLRLREDIGVDLAVVKAPHTSRVKDYMVGFASRKTTYEQKIKRILKYYRRECTIWARISADSKQAEDNNLLQFYGFLESYDFNQMPAFVAKYYALGDARSYINQNTQPRLSNKQKIYLISDIAKALTFIHSTCGIAHRDVRGSNILLKAKAHRLIGILGDFGSAKEFTIDVPWFLSSSDSGGDNWCPPEYKRPGGFHDDKGPGDIWSLGCTMLELLQEKDPWYQVSLGDIPAKIAAYEHPPKGANILQDHYDFITACWTTEDRRPTADDFQSRVEQTGIQYLEIVSLSEHRCHEQKIEIMPVSWMDSLLSSTSSRGFPPGVLLECFIAPNYMSVSQLRISTSNQKMEILPSILLPDDTLLRNGQIWNTPSEMA